MFDCVLGAWRRHESELMNFLAHRTGDRAAAEDLLQEVFLKAMRQGMGFCSLENPRAWLFQVARTTLIDHARLAKAFVELPDELAAPASDERAPVDELDACVARNLARLAADDRHVIEVCDLQGRTVRDFAAQQGLSLAAAKSRLLRARQRLREALISHCQVRFDASGNVCCHTEPARD